MEHVRRLVNVFWTLEQPSSQNVWMERVVFEKYEGVYLVVLVFRETM